MGKPVPTLLKFLLSVADPSHIMYGSDFPFTPMPLVLKNLAALEEYLDKEPEVGQYKNMILYENAKTLFGRCPPERTAGQPDSFRKVMRAVL